MNTEKVKNILFILPSNLGDLILTFPSFDMIREICPQAEIDCVVSPAVKEFMKQANIVSSVMVYQKNWRVREKAKFTLSLRYKYDLIIDFKNTAIPFFAAPRLRTPLLRRRFDKGHKRDFYLRLSLKAVGKKVIPTQRHLDFHLDISEKESWDKILHPSIFIAPASRSSTKVYPTDYYIQVIRELSSTNTIVLIGDETAEKIGEEIGKVFGKDDRIINLISKTTLPDLFYIFKNYVRLLIASDSAPLHLASYLNIPTVAIFGPTSFKKYGPTSKGSVILINKNVGCLGCGKDHCPFTLQCMYGIKPQEVINSALSML